MLKCFYCDVPLYHRHKCPALLSSVKMGVRRKCHCVAGHSRKVITSLEVPDRDDWSIYLFLLRHCRETEGV